MLASRDRNAIAERLAAAQRRVAELEAELVRRALAGPSRGQRVTLPAFRPSSRSTCERPSATGRPLSVALLDVDGFGRLNLRAGLRRPATASCPPPGRSALSARTGDLVCRLAADEFAMRLADLAAPAAEELLGGVLVALEELQTPDVRGISGVHRRRRDDRRAQRRRRCWPRPARRSSRARQAGGGRVAIFPARSTPSRGRRRATPTSSRRWPRRLRSATATRASTRSRSSTWTAGSPSRSALAAEEVERDPHRGPAARHRQGRRARRDPAQAGAARRPRVGDHAPAPGDRRAHHARDPRHGPDREASSATSTSAGTGAGIPTGSPARRSRSAPASSSPATPTTR